jgi:hypothetical protein
MGRKRAIGLLIGAWCYPLIPTGDLQMLSSIPFAIGVTWAVVVMSLPVKSKSEDIG